MGQFHAPWGAILIPKHQRMFGILMKDNMIIFLRKVALTLIFLPTVALSQGALENPASSTTESGIGIISGWHCTAREVEALVDNVSVGYTYVGSDRSDTKSVCGGVSATGFALLTNFNVFTPGLHNLKVLADGKQFGEVNFTTVKSGGVEYLQNVSQQTIVENFPSTGSTATLTWNQSKQSFVVTSIAITGATALKFEWPANGALIAGYDEVSNKGLDIGGQAGDPVYASADGKVVFAGSGLIGYGNLIIIKHDNTYLTAYAHNQRLLVAEGQTIVKGQQIAEMGASESERVKLHFEIRRNGISVDPISFLPNR